jgi:TolB protein
VFPRWSPDGRSIAYVRTGDHNIVIMNADGSGAQVLFTPAVEEYSARWSPDGTRLAVNISGAEPGLLVMDLGTSSQELIRQGTSSGPAWSPDGRTIAFDYFSQQPGASEQIYVMNADGSGSRNITSASGDNYEATF